MSKRVEKTGVYPIKRETIWKAYTDHERWKEWTFMSKSELAKEGSPDRNGVGAVRLLGSNLSYATEEVVLFKPYDRMEYKVRKGGLPFKNHHGVVIFEDEGEGTKIIWYATFESKIWGLGWLWKLIVSYVFSSSLRGLKKFPFETVR